MNILIYAIKNFDIVFRNFTIENDIELSAFHEFLLHPYIIQIKLYGLQF